LSQGPQTQAAAAGSAAAAAAAAQESCPQANSSITVKFLLSIDRRNDTAAAIDTVSSRVPDARRTLAFAA
jgi:hypothetical protein